MWVRLNKLEKCDQNHVQKLNLSISSNQPYLNTVVNYNYGIIYSINSLLYFPVLLTQNKLYDNVIINSQNVIYGPENHSIKPKCGYGYCFLLMPKDIIPDAQETWTSSVIWIHSVCYFVTFNF